MINATNDVAFPLTVESRLISVLSLLLLRYVHLPGKSGKQKAFLFSASICVTPLPTPRQQMGLLRALEDIGQFTQSHEKGS